MVNLLFLVSQKILHVIVINVHLINGTGAANFILEKYDITFIKDIADHCLLETTMTRTSA